MGVVLLFMRLLSYCFIALFLGLVVGGCKVQTTPPELIRISPGQAFVGQEATLTGYQFGNEPVVLFSTTTTTTSVSVTSKSETTLRITVPPVSPGSTQVRVRNDQGTTDPLPFEVRQPEPSISRITPTNGLPGTPVVISGAFLNQLIQVKVNDIRAVVSDSTAQSFTILVPSGTPRGQAVITIETRGGVQTVGFLVAGTPRITSISPLIATPGSELVVRGINLTNGSVRINNSFTDNSKTVVTDTEIRTIIPPEATSGRVLITVFQTLTAISADSIRIVRAPVAGINTLDGVAGDKLLLGGFNLADVTSVTFNKFIATFRVVSDGQLEATVPTLPAPGNATIALSSPGGSYTVPQSFFYYTAPSPISVSPARQLRDRPISITGQQLYRISEVRVNGILAEIFERTEGTGVKVNVPITATSGPVTVKNRAGTVTSTVPLVVIQKPLISEIIPQSARPGERVVLRGNFLTDAQVIFTGTTAAAVNGGKNEDTEYWVLVPANAQTGPIRVTNVTNEPVLTDVFTVLRLVTIADFTPKSAKIGDEIVLTGTNFTSVKEVRFNNGTLPAPTFFTSENAIRVTVPTGAVAGQICLVNGAGTVCTTANFALVR